MDHCAGNARNGNVFDLEGADVFYFRPDGEKLEDDEDVALPDWATTVPPKPAVAEKAATETVNALVTSLVNSSALRELETEIDVTQDRAATNAKEINLLKTNLSDYSYDLQMVSAVEINTDIRFKITLFRSQIQRAHSRTIIS